MPRHMCQALILQGGNQISNSLIGLLFHWAGGLSAASFYVPYKAVKHWSWEVYWIVGGVSSWIIAPWFFAYFQTNDLFDVLSSTSNETLFWCYFFGFAWGFGALTFGLTMRYLGLSLGMAVSLGLTTAFGTLIPPIYDGSVSTLIQTTSGQVILLGVAITLCGIMVIAAAGRAKEKEMSDEDRKASIAEFDFKKGIMVAVFCGIMSSCFAYALAAAEEIRLLTLAAGTDPLQQGLPALCIILTGGMTTNLIWCGYLIIKNKSAGNFVGNVPEQTKRLSINILTWNYLFCALAGLIWYFQFFFYTMGESLMGDYSFSSWALHMASIIIFSTLWGFYFKEWKGVKTKTFLMVCSGIGILVLSTIIIGWGNSIGSNL
jgi:L-rhamnose-H+ transport protein